MAPYRNKEKNISFAVAVVCYFQKIEAKRNKAIQIYIHSAQYCNPDWLRFNDVISTGITSQM